jgi:hypothetical protein
VPWCAACDRFLSPSSVLVDGSCPSCGRAVEAGHARPAAAVDRPPDGEDEPLESLPWHFKLLLGAIALYLGYRAFQGVEWVVGLL